MEAFIHGIPKAELHIHIEGALEPELMFELAAKNGCDLPFESVADIRRAYKFSKICSPFWISIIKVRKYCSMRMIFTG